MDTRTKRVPRAARLAAWLTMSMLALVAGCEGSGGEAPGDDAGPCDPGALGCACARGDVCATTEDGEALLCEEGLCVGARCAPGTTACVCRAGTECDGEGLECRDGICRGTGCVAGQMGCECLAGSCGGGLYCDTTLGGGTCVDATGYPGGPCPEMGLCREQSRCDSDLDVCVPCSPGSQGCVPSAGRCNDGLLLVAGRCIPPEPGAPADPQCYTPCRGDLVAEDGTVRRCGADGLLDGCVGDLVCQEGSCVPPGSAAPTCAVDADCPGHQRCIAGGCYYDCERDAECGVGRICHQHACRVPCAWPATAGSACPEGTTCESPSGSGGVCMPVTPVDPDAPEHTEVDASFALDVDTLVLGEGAGRFRLAHDGHARETFTIERISHRAYDRDGALIEEAAADDAPLDWVELRHGDTRALAGSLEVVIEPGCDVTTCVPIEIRSAAPPTASWTRWEGTLRVRHASLGDRYVSLAWARGLDGRWSGTMFYFASFGEGGVAAWAAGDRSRATDVENALVQRWAAFRSGRMMGGFRELQAMLTATSSESWRWRSTRDACLALHPDGRGACYLFDGDASGIRSYVTNEREVPVPTGVTELPFAVSLRSEGDRLHLRGRVESSFALHYAGDPAMEIVLAGDPNTCVPGVSTDCVAFVSSMSSESAVGGRYLPRTGACASGFEARSFPWLVAGFREGTFLDESTGAPSRTECRDSLVPFTGANAAARSASLAGANPVPDGRPRCRTMRALDGALVARETLFVLFEERFHACGDVDDPDAFSAYGYMLLARQPDALRAEDFRGHVLPASIPDRASTLGVSCDPDLVLETLGAPVSLDGSSGTRTAALELAQALRTGRVGSGSPIPTAEVHYYCQDTGLVDGGPNDDGSATASRVPCPAGSNVTYFAFDAAPTAAEIAALDCQSGYDAAAGTRGTCGPVVDAWIAEGRVVPELVWTCVDGATCSANRSDLRAGRAFFEPGDAVFMPLDAAIEDAFRYKLRFQSPDGRSVGFAPVVCDPSSDLTPYCYEPEAIEALRERVDCMAAIYRTYGATTIDPRMTALREALSRSFGASEIHDPRQSSPLLVEGFERLYAELLIMLADDALTNAYRSRFDSAATRGASFEGSRFEPNGIDLSGVAGYEMRSLYQAAQYYQLALDRFYDLERVLVVAMARGDAGTAADDVVTPGTVTYYLERLIRGAAQKSRAWAEIARRYHRLHRADLARHVLERAYAGSYLESVAIARFMQRIAEQVDAAHAPQMQLALDDAMRRYRVAMTDMRQVHETLTDDVTYFGFPADYVPFPVRADNDFRAGNAFEDVLRTTLEFVAEARGHEETAIGSSRAFDTDAASFQAELVRLQRSYEERLAPICGYLTGDDGRTYPAITRYASRDDDAASFGDPCGRMGNGEIHDQLLRLEQLASQRQLLATRFAHIQEEMSDEAERVDSHCELLEGIADFEYRQGERTLSLQDQVRSMSLAMSTLDRALSTLHGILGFAAQDKGKPFAIGYGIAAVIANSAVLGLQAGVNATEHEIAEIQLETARWRTVQQCESIRIDSEVLMRAKLRQLVELRLETEQLHLQIALSEAELRRAVLQAQRVQQELAEAEQLAIRVESARNDPNVRLYRNDAILNADRSFELAAQHAYRATRVFEYYASRSYPGLERLFQIRMVSRGEDNLERYMADLRHHYLLFEEEVRAPANRVERLSLMDDILGIPLLREDGTPYSQREREDMLHERLTDASMLDANGHLSIAFRTSTDELSPCTRNHKINFIEVAIQGSGLGDDEASVNVWQEGTGVIESFGGGAQYYRLPPALSIVQAYFGRNNTVFDPVVYRRFELRERPFVNTQWRLVLDQRHDRDNQDIDLRQITDVYLYVYYTDFTDPGACTAR
ncbi:WAP domain-containing protein [Sandaracinus amylolyticus]|uniref:WAP domain-containing protein n=1 Tax=Sandaracinus amylolyticus TaxID=927083 RepID=UPI001F237634|nr:WAP domain-containing protein [Sandaracinus amylolyticus]UJR82189.1 Hypothetical protein I5071_42540 [Sandaracinus amylolyticus]